MSVSIYYEARRPEPLTVSEQAAIQHLVSKYAVEDQLEKYFQTGAGLNWESFCVYEPASSTEPDVIFEGATKLPDNSADAAWHGIKHWCALLSEIRSVLPHAAWSVHVDSHIIPWDQSRGAYDPSR